MRDALAELAEAERLIALGLDRQKRALALLQAAREVPFKDTFQPPPMNEHRRLHRPNRPPKIDLDPELQAFVRARIDHMTFVELAEAVASRFPPARRVSRSAIHRWFQRNRPGR